MLGEQKIIHLLQRVENSLRKKEDFLIEVSEDVYLVLKKKRDFRQEAELLFTMVIQFSRDVNEEVIRSYPFQKRWEVRYQIDILTFWKESLKGKVNGELFHQLDREVLALRLGGKIPASYFISEKGAYFKRFIQTSHLDHAMLALGMQLSFDPSFGPIIPIERSESEIFHIPWEKITITNRLEKICSYLYKNELLFQTDENDRLLNKYSLFYRGIIEYDLYKQKKWIPFDWQDPKEWGGGYQLEVWSVFEKHPSDKTNFLDHTHAYLIVKDRNGFVYSAGQDIFRAEFYPRYFSLFGVQKGYNLFMTPDRYVFASTANLCYRSHSFKIREKEFMQLFQLVEREKRQLSRTLSVIDNNCVSFVKRTLREILHISMGSQMHSTHFLFQFFSTHWIYEKVISRWLRWFRHQPQMVQKGLYFFPPYYIIQLLFGSVFKMMMRSELSYHKPFKWKDLLFFPWRTCIDHPFALYQNLLHFQSLDDSDSSSISRERASSSSASVEL